MTKAGVNPSDGVANTQAYTFFSPRLHMEEAQGHAWSESIKRDVIIATVHK